MAVIKKTSFAQNLERYAVLVTDTDINSKYFKISELPDVFTGGKNAFLIAGSAELVADTKILIEIKDSAGNVIYNEPGEGIISSSIGGEIIVTEYYEGVSKVVAVYVYPDTAYGPCTITVLGELSQYTDENNITQLVPADWENKYNVKWQRTINVNPSLSNTTKIRFYKRPKATITEILSPIYRIESGSKVNSGVSQSFAEIKLSQLETFAGDVKRVKVFRTSEGDISDYDLIQDILVESKELLSTFELSGSVVGNTGILTSETIENYWNTGSLSAELTSSRVESGLKLNGSGNFSYIPSLDIKSANTYELNLDAFYSSSTSSNLEIFLSYVSASTTFTSSIAKLNGTAPTKNLLDTTIPFKIGMDYPTASLYFSQSTGQWHLGNISLKLSQDTAFSPDEISFITTMPTIIGDETYNFKFEFYDVNNNYVPVAVTQSATFTGGNIGKLLRSLTFDSDRTAFRFSSGSFGNPPFQQLGFKITKTNLTGSVTYSSASFDTNGNYINPLTYSNVGYDYPGLLTNRSDAGATLTIANFSGSLSNVLIGSIVYTASCDGIDQFETIYRFEDGDNAPGIFVTANTNQFIYKATDLSLNPTGQNITIEAKRKNLASATTPITVNSGSGKPGLTFISTNPTNGVDTYLLSGSIYPYSTGETIYYFSGSDQFGNQFSDAIKISPVKILDGFSIVASNENTSFPAYSTGNVFGGFAASSGSITVKVGNEVISYASPIANNKFSASISTTSNLTANTFDGINYSINALSADSGSLTLLIKYQDGGGTIISASKDITYSKVKKAAPILNFIVGNNNQSVTAKSTGAQLDSFLTASFSVLETYDGSTTQKTLTITKINTTNGYSTGSTTTTTLALPNMANGTDSVDISITGSVVDSESITRNVFGFISLAKVKKAAPVLEFVISNNNQSVDAKSTGAQITSFSDSTLSVREIYNGSTSNLTLSAAPTINSSSAFTTITKSATSLSYPSMVSGTNSVELFVTGSVTDSEGSSRIVYGGVSLTKVRKAAPSVILTATPQTQTVAATSQSVQTGTLSTVTLDALEGATSVFNSASVLTSNFTGASISTKTLTLGTIGNTITAASASIGINYTDSEGTTINNTINVSAVKAVAGNVGANGTNGVNGADGGVGPGVVYRGDWAANTIYYSSSIRVDVVRGSDSQYYLTKLSHTSSATGTNDKPITGTSYTNFWNSFGATFDSVATNILLAQDATITRGLVMGTYGVSDKGFIRSANASALMSGKGYYLDTTGSARFGDPAGQYMLFDESTGLTVNGNINVVGGNAATQTFANTAANRAADSASISASAVQSNLNTVDGKIFTDALGRIVKTPSPSTKGLYLGSTNLGYYSGSAWKTYMDDTGLFYLTGSAGGNALLWDGATLTIKGTITVTGGDAATQTFANTAAGRAADSASISASAAQSNAISTAASDATTKANAAYNNATAQLQLLADGGYSGSFIGSTTIYSPNIGGQNGYISNILRVGQNGITLDGGNKKIYVGTGTYANANTPFYFASGSTNVFSLGDKLTWNGNALSVNGTINITNPSTANNGGKVGSFDNGDSLTAGSAGGWLIDSTKIYNSNVEIDNSNSRIDFKSGGTVKTRIKSGSADIGYVTTQTMTLNSGTETDTTGIGSATIAPVDADTTVNAAAGTSTFTVPSSADGYKVSVSIPYPTLPIIGRVIATLGASTSWNYSAYALIDYTITKNGNPFASGTKTLVSYSDDGLTANDTINFDGFSAGTILIPNIGTVNTSDSIVVSAYLSVTVNGRLNPDAVNGTQGGSITTRVYGWDLGSGTCTFQAVANRAEYATNGLQIGSAEGTYAAVGDAAGAGYVGLFAGNVLVSGILTAGSISTSDKRTKTNVKIIKNGVDTIKKLKPVSFDWLQHKTGNFEFEKGYGFIADDIENVLPELVYTKRGFVYDDTKHLEYTSFHAIAIKAIQELTEKVERLEAKLSGSI